MIYEKRQIFPISVSADDLSKPRIITDKGTPVTILSKKPEQNDCVSETISRRRTKRSLRRFSKSIRKRRHRFALTVFIALSLAICFFAADSRLFDGRFAELAISGTKKAVLFALGENNNEVSSQIVTPRTIYTLTFSEDITVQNSSSVNHEKPVTHREPMPEETALVSGSSMQSNSLDGVKYYPITSLDLSPESIYALSNDTGFDIDAQSFLGKTPKSLEGISVTDEPLVLIIHTHGSESYSEYTDSYPENAPTRSEEPSKNVTRVGKEIAETLSGFGICTIHCDTLHDNESFINAYTESAETVKQYLKEYPSIRFVIDVHRDAIIRDDGESIKAVKNISGQNYAQLMFVVGTNELGHNHPMWQDNLCLSVRLQESISDAYPGLCRSINLRNVPFNQQLSSGYILLEAGTSANTLDEALLSARVFGQELARLILE